MIVFDPIVRCKFGMKVYLVPIPTYQSKSFPTRRLGSRLWYVGVHLSQYDVYPEISNYHDYTDKKVISHSWHR